MKIEFVKEVRKSGYEDKNINRWISYVIWTSANLIVFSDVTKSAKNIYPGEALAWHKNQSKCLYKKMHTKSFIYKYRNIKTDKVRSCRTLSIIQVISMGFTYSK